MGGLQNRAAMAEACGNVPKRMHDRVRIMATIMLYDWGLHPPPHWRKQGSAFPPQCLMFGSCRHLLWVGCCCCRAKRASECFFCIKGHPHTGHSVQQYSSGSRISRLDPPFCRPAHRCPGPLEVPFRAAVGAQAPPNRSTASRQPDRLPSPSPQPLIPVAALAVVGGGAGGAAEGASRHVPVVRRRHVGPPLPPGLAGVGLAQSARSFAAESGLDAPHRLISRPQRLTPEPTANAMDTFQF